ncbi:MAG: aspartate aminotransferase family protein, partial [Marmoricola sp.]
LLHRTAALRRPQFFASARWPGYTVLNTTLQSTKSGGPLAGAWAVVNSIGDAGYLELTGKALGAVDEIVAGIERIEALRIVVRPDSTLIAVATDGSCDVFTIVDAMSRVGWHVQPQLSFNGTPPSFHLSVSAATADHVEEFLEELEKAVAGAVETGPVHVAPEIVELVRSLDPADLTEEDFDGLLAGLGLGGDPSAVDSEGASVGGAPLGLPEAMAPINALLDLASPTLREALLTAFLDRLLRPTRL